MSSPVRHDPPAVVQLADALLQIRKTLLGRSGGGPDSSPHAKTERLAEIAMRNATAKLTHETRRTCRLYKASIQAANPCVLAAATTPALRRPRSNLPNRVRSPRRVAT